MRITLLTSGGGSRSEVIITCHHAIVDGEAMGSLAHELLSTYDAMDRGRYEPAARSTAPLPAVEDMLRYPLTPEFRNGRLTAFIERQISLKQAHDIGGFESSEPAGTASRSTLVHRSLPSSFVDAVRERCRSEGASVQGALGAALIAAGRDEIHAGDACVLPLVSAVTLRRRLPGLVSADLGLFSSGVRTIHAVERATDFWQLARDVRRAIAAGLDSEEDVCALLLQREAMDHYMTAAEPGFAWLSNVGVLHLPSEVAGGRVRASHGAFSMHAFGPLIHAHAATSGRQFTWNFVYPEPAISRSVADAFSRRAVEHLVNACRPDVPASLSAQT